MDHLYTKVIDYIRDHIMYMVSGSMYLSTRPTVPKIAPGYTLVTLLCHWFDKTISQLPLKER